MLPSYELTTYAENDWKAIVEYTLKNFGEKQLLQYTNALIKCIDIIKSKKGHHRYIQIKNHTLLIKHCKKHYLFAIERQNKPILIIAIFHERMDLMKRLKNRLS
mgnify:CR=1 FL=1